MKTYKLELVEGSKTIIAISELEETSYWRKLGYFQPDKMSLYILMAATHDTNLSFEFVKRFERECVSDKLVYPRIITTDAVLNWIGRQVAAMV